MTELQSEGDTLVEEIRASRGIEVKVKEALRKQESGWTTSNGLIFWRNRIDCRASGTIQNNGAYLADVLVAKIAR